MAFEPVTRTQPVRLTEDERSSKGQELAMALEEKKVLLQDLAALKQRYKAKVSDLDVTISALQEVVARGVEYRQVECMQRPNRVDGLVELLRTDTMQVILTRAMTREETEQAAQLPLRETER